MTRNWIRALFIVMLCLAGYFYSIDIALAQGVSVQVKNGEVRDVLTALAKSSNVNLIIDDSVQGKLNICLSDVEFDTAMQLIARIKNLHYEKQNGVYVVRAAKNDAADNGMNTKKQVMVEAKVISLDNSEAKKLGMEWEWSKLPQSPDVDYTKESTSESVWNSEKNRYETVTTTQPHKKITRHWKNGEGIPGVIHFGETNDGQPLEMYYAAKLDALFTSGKARVLARPNVMAVDGQEAVINIGGSVPVPTVSTTNTASTTSINYHDVGVILKYKPQVHDDGTISAAVHIEVSSPLYVEEMKAYRFNKRTVDTVVRLKNDEIMVIGGLIGSEEMTNMSRIPFLSDLPVLGQLFRHQEKSNNKSEVMIFLTAKTVE